MNTSSKSNNDGRVSTLVRKYEELSYTSRIRPYLRRWMSTNTTYIDPDEKMSKFAQLVDKVVTAQKYKFFNESCEEDIGAEEKDGLEDQNAKMGSSLTTGQFASHKNDVHRDSQQVIYRKNVKNNFDRDLLNWNEVKAKPLTAARSIEDFEELIYFNDKAQEDKVTPMKVSACENVQICQDTVDSVATSSAAAAVEDARQRAKEEEERYRRSVVDDEDDDDDDEEFDVTKLLGKEVIHKREEDEVIKIKEKVIEEKVNKQQIKESDKNAQLIRTPDIKRDKKEFVVDELINTERIYIENLELVIKTYLQYLRQHRFKSEMIKSVFSNIESIHEHTQIFLLHLEDCKYNYAEIGKVFCKHRDLFDKYPKYCRERKKSHQIITTDLKEIVVHLQCNFNDKLGLNSSLLKPIQRLAKYELLLISLNQLLLQDNNNITSVQNAIVLIQKIARIADTMVTLNTVKRCPYSFNDIGTLVMQNEFKLLTPEKIEAMVFLFGRMIIFAEIVSNEEYNFRYAIPLDCLRFNRPKNGNIMVLEMFTKSNKSVYNLESKDLKVLNSWTKEINAILWKQLEMYKGKVQSETFQASLNHFKSFDKTDSVSKTSKKTLKGNLSNKPTTNQKASKPPQSSKITNPLSWTKTKSSTKTEPAKSKHTTKLSNTVEDSSTIKSSPRTEIKKDKSKINSNTTAESTTTTTKSSSKTIKQPSNYEATKSVNSNKTVNKESQKSAKTEKSLENTDAGKSLSNAVEKSPNTAKSANTGSNTSNYTEATKSATTPKATVSRTPPNRANPAKTKNLGTTENKKYKSSTLSGSTFYFNCDGSPTSSKSENVEAAIGTSKISSAKLKAAKATTKTEEKKIAKKLEKEKDTKRRLERRMAMIHRM